MQTFSEALLEHIGQPAFFGSEGKIVYANKQAEKLLFLPGMSLSGLLGENYGTYADFTEGALCISGRSGDTDVTLNIEKCGDTDLFIVADAVEEDPRLQGMAVMEKALRYALNDAMAAAYGLEQNVPGKVPGDLQKAHFRMLRILNEVTAVADDPQVFCRKQYTDMPAFLAELAEKAENLLAQAGRKFSYTPLQGMCSTMVDREMYTAAVFSLLSNAVKFSPEESLVTVSATATATSLTLTVHNLSRMPLPGDVFRFYARPAAVEDSRFGTGLGILAARNVALLHGGSLLVTERNGVSVALTVAVRPCTVADLHSSVRVPDIGDSGFDAAMIAMADVLPGSSFEGK